ncbi:MAG: TaqI-like C-terminal specificity domain-containing protein [bacterium]
MLTLVKTPKQAIGALLKKQKIFSQDLALFEIELQKFVDIINPQESEEHNKNWLIEFLNKSFYNDNPVNTYGRKDLAIYSLEKKSKVEVLIEAKKPLIRAEMPTTDNLNCKAMQELLYYFLEETVENKNLELKNLIITDCYSWYIFDALEFNKIFGSDKDLLRDFRNFKNKGLIGDSTADFYTKIAKGYIDKHQQNLPFVYFNLHPVNQPFVADKSLVLNLYKIFSPFFLLKKPVANDSNSLNSGFYHELLHIMGLEEKADKGKKLIGRKATERQSGSLLENAIIKIENSNKLYSLDSLNQYGLDEQEQLFTVGLELSITWINRILFLKLLEGQLVSFNKDISFKFLSSSKITGFDELNDLFFQVLAKKEAVRSDEFKTKFGFVPYLNSSLFEPTTLESEIFGIDNLNSNQEIEVYPSTILKNNQGRKQTGKLRILDYLLSFLEAYDFGSTAGSEEVVDESKAIINASVLGLIFEKINGYKDGSFFTPGFITSYMARTTVQKAIVAKFNQQKGWNCLSFEQLYDKIEDKLEANQIIDSLKIVDPAVGSGHFLVSVLNEIILAKSSLKILQDENGKTLRDYEIVVENDELIIFDEEGNIFEYKPASVESSRVQKTIFDQKQKIIENCLFGVDINQNSVKICQLRLWIELLKNAYYSKSEDSESGVKSGRYLQTLPNIDINIKCGNSLISRFSLDTPAKSFLKKIDWSISDYKAKISQYQATSDKQVKWQIRKELDKIKQDFESELPKNDKKYLELEKVEKELNEDLFELEGKLKKQLESRKKELEKQIQDLKVNPIYHNAFEWRFEFPEVLDDEGGFVGFDVVVGNPPYGVDLDDDSKALFKIIYEDVHLRTPDTFNYFISRSIQLLRENGFNSFIVPNNLLFQNEFEKTRKLILTQEKVDFVYNLGDNIFDDANVPTCLYLFQKQNQGKFDLSYADYRNWGKDPKNLFNSDKIQKISNTDLLKIPSFIFGVSSEAIKIIEKVKNQSVLVDDIVEEMASGISTGGDKIFRISETKAKDLNLESDLLKKVLVGGELGKYSINYTDNLLLYMNKSVQIEKYQNAANYLSEYEEQLKMKRETVKGMIPYWCLHWPRYVGLFTGEKIIMRQTSDKIIATYDNQGFFVLNSILVLKLKTGSPFSYNLVLGILNSSLNQFIYSNFTQEGGRTFAEVKPKNVRKLFIPLLDTHEKQKIAGRIEGLVERIILMKNVGNTPSASLPPLIEGNLSDAAFDTASLESQIDELVFELYGLSVEERGVVLG